MGLIHTGVLTHSMPMYQSVEFKEKRREGKREGCRGGGGGEYRRLGRSTVSCFGCQQQVRDIKKKEKNKFERSGRNCQVQVLVSGQTNKYWQDLYWYLPVRLDFELCLI